MYVFERRGGGEDPARDDDDDDDDNEDDGGRIADGDWPLKYAVVGENEVCGC